MFLKRIELSGFKSFADKTELEFVPGITAVVGPNGSGKSNISDSIRWVLGEQSARSLRGGNMQDIIFAGSDSRKAVNFSEVSLTLDNHDEQLSLDFSEVTVTRRLHRSGESEYFINKQPCRLKDITELFMDTGVGKESYSIIGQGRIEEILSTRSEDRRGIFEEASGIVKYKARKKESQKKLDETDQNLIRIHDLISELEDQIEPLQKQSEKALTFKRLKEELKNIEVSLLVQQIEEFHLQWTEAESDVKRLEKEQLELSTVVRQHDAQLESDRLHLRRLEDELEQLQADLLKWSEEVEKAEGLGEVLKERNKNMLQQKEQNSQSIAAQESRVARLQAEDREIADKLERVVEEIQQTEARHRDEETRLTGITRELVHESEEELKAKLLENLNEAARVRNEIRYAEQQLEQQLRKQEKLDQEKREALEKQQSLEQKKIDFEHELKKNESGIESVRKRYIQTSEAIQANQKLVEETQSTLRKWQQKLDGLASRKETMKELHDDYDGFFHGVKEVLKQGNRANGLPGVKGAIAELIKVSQKYETAIETALGSALQHIVMEDEACSRKAIAYLKQRHIGRATFLPLTVIKGRQLAAQEFSKMKAAPGFVGVAAALVEFDKQYENVITSLLGNVVIAETLEQANRIAATIQYRYRIVTLEGDVVHAGGSMTGGSRQKNNANLLGRQRKIEELDQQLKQTGEQLVQIQEKYKQMQEQAVELKQQQDLLRQEGEQKRLEEQKIRSSFEQIDQAYRQIHDQLQLVELEQRELLQEQALHSGNRDEFMKQQQQLDDQEKSIQRKITESEQQRKERESVKEELQQQLTHIKVKAASLKQESQSLQEQLERSRQELQAAEIELHRTHEKSTQLETDEQSYQTEKTNQIAQLNEMKLRKQSCMEQIDLKKTERLQKQQNLEAEENETREQRVQLKKVEEQLHQLDVKTNRLDVELDNLLRTLSEDYELSFELAKERFSKPENVDLAKQQVKELKRQIAALGEVNLGAIEEYERVHERFKFLSAQKDDLVEAKQTLYRVIGEMEAEMSQRFQLTFDEIRGQFVVAFSKLFGGGRADLVLTDPDHLLDTGVDIVAQPPGKKLQNLQLLSGGERALTAIALLFAILHIKPVPFCVLDEVEAALDEANVSRFAEYLREFSEQTQFIVVSHRKGTMEEADVLYGVAMEEDGVSKLVSVRLDEAVSA